MSYPRSYYVAKGRIRDRGGAAAKTGGKLVPKKGQPWGTCPSCGVSRPVTLNAWFRRSRPLCARCGTPLVPSKAAQKQHLSLRAKVKTSPPRMCGLCGARLREGNKRALCSPCMSRYTREHPGWQAYPTVTYNRTIREFVVEQTRRRR